jgi:hypothetical protein
MRRRRQVRAGSKPAPQQATSNKQQATINNQQLTTHTMNEYTLNNLKELEAESIHNG